MSRIAGRFTRVESRRRARKLVLGLLSDLPRRNCWTINEWVGARPPDGMQHLPGRAKWGRPSRSATTWVTAGRSICTTDEAVLVVDEIGDVKKGTGTVGVQRGTPARRTRREQPGSRLPRLLDPARTRGVDREPYVPRSWTSDPDRCRVEGLGDKAEFATKPEPAARMVTRFLDAATGSHGSRPGFCYPPGR
ncbi:transposase [Streptomyces sp. MSC1_001]|jgi:SRSO17 transposase|uniref:transposase n=1 Tax=Streptomyces sp. MSC1_001 TaxID=2909263 RepID=UPI0035B0B647